MEEYQGKTAQRFLGSSVVKLCKLQGNIWRKIIRCPLQKTFVRDQSPFFDHCVLRNGLK